MVKQVEGGISAPKGVLAAGVSCGIKRTGFPDLALVVSEQPGVVAGVFTRNLVKAAPVLLCQSKIEQGGKFSALVVNSGNANACTGPSGMRDANQTAKIAAKLLNRPAQEVFVASTGVIGEPLPMEKVSLGIAMAVSRVRPHQGGKAARAIMTTDTFPKEAAVSLMVGGRSVRIGGMAKGSGMIYPRMATMLGFVASDANISASLLARSLRIAINQSFNRITVDGDTSTNDMVLAFANGLSGCPRIQGGSHEYLAFQQGLNWVSCSLAQMIVRDGEGATKMIRVKVKGAGSEREAEIVAFAIANSSLVKTAFFGEDCNWGRILAAIGSSGVKVRPERIDLSMGPVQIVKNGVGLGKDQEEQTQEILKEREIDLGVHLHQGNAQAEVLTCDLSFDYVKINASYRT
jgi:glutamate N-acetyltransferase/amino-acid N-acetyltransferase